MESARISGNENVRPTVSPKLFVSHNCGFVIDFFLRFRLLFASSPDHRSLLPDDIQVIQPGMEKFQCSIHCTFYSILLSIIMTSGQYQKILKEAFKKLKQIRKFLKSILVLSL